MTPLRTIAYEASGGPSQHRSYEDGEDFTIESQDEGYVLAWSADKLALGFLRAVSQLVNRSATTELTPQTNGRAVISVEDALQVVGDHPEMTTVEVNDNNETFVWTAVSPPGPGELRTLGRVALAFSALDRGRLERLIADTATPHVKSDIDGIIASAEHLTHSARSATA